MRKVKERNKEYNEYMQQKVSQILNLTCKACSEFIYIKFSWNLILAYEEAAINKYAFIVCISMKTRFLMLSLAFVSVKAIWLSR